MKPIGTLYDKLSKYKSLQVKGILDVWRDSESERQSIDLDVEQIDVKIEPQWLGPFSPSGSDIIEIDTNENAEEHQHAEQEELSQLERAVNNALNIEEGETSQNLAQTSQVSEQQWAELYSDIFESSQPFHSNDDLQGWNSVRPSSSRQSFKKASQKRRKSGFL